MKSDKCNITQLTCVYLVTCLAYLEGEHSLGRELLRAEGWFTALPDAKGALESP